MENYRKCHLHGFKYKCTSNYGNPSYWVTFEDEEGILHRGYTASNASAGYTVPNYYGWQGVIYLDYHFTRAGSCIIDRIKHNRPSDIEGEKDDTSN